MSKLIYIIPWAICDTENIYTREVSQTDSVVPEIGDQIDDWTVKHVIPNPDRRSKDIFVELDVYCGYDFKNRSKDVSVIQINNSAEHLMELGYTQTEEPEKSFLRKRVLKIEV
ncbi:MAG: hypothetical protein IJ079_00320 [Lachnospiraceae bacterium]|nr:hypothetical protein [Lachnospiraceae bacterium]